MHPHSHLDSSCWKSFLHKVKNPHMTAGPGQTPPKLTPLASRTGFFSSYSHDDQSSLSGVIQQDLIQPHLPQGLGKGGKSHSVTPPPAPIPRSRPHQAQDACVVPPKLLSVPPPPRRKGTLLPPSHEVPSSAPGEASPPGFFLPWPITTASSTGRGGGGGVERACYMAY